MSKSEIPSIMRAWQYTTTSGGLEKNLKLNTAAKVPQPKKDEHLIKVLATAINPVDYKPAEVTLLSAIAITKPATPCTDVAGIIIKPASSSTLCPGQLVFGASSKTPFAGAALAEYAAVPSGSVTPYPDTGVTATSAAGSVIAGLTAYQALIPYVRSGTRVFINAGSGGTGTFGIQIAHNAGAHVTVSCSTANVELCKSLGADQVLDYKASPLLSQLQESAKRNGPFDHVVDNVFADPDLYWHAHTYTTQRALYVNVAGSPTIPYFWTTMKIRILPSFLGGGKRKFTGMLTSIQLEQLMFIANRLGTGELKTVLDQSYSFEDAIEAFRRSKSGRAKGKIVIEVASSW